MAPEKNIFNRLFACEVYRSSYSSLDEEPFSDGNLTCVAYSCTFPRFDQANKYLKRIKFSSCCVRRSLNQTHCDVHDQWKASRLVICAILLRCLHWPLHAKRYVVLSSKLSVNCAVHQDIATRRCTIECSYGQFNGTSECKPVMYEDENTSQSYQHAHLLTREQ